MRKNRNEKGFILIEIVITVMLIGIIGAFVSFFLYTGVQGYFSTKQATEGALKCQVAMDRISLELRNARTVPSASTDSITYTSDDFPGIQRRIRWDSDTKYIYLWIDSNGGNPAVENPMLGNVASFEINIDPDNLDNNAGNEISGIRIAFTSEDIGSGFKIQIYPRNFITPP